MDKRIRFTKILNDPIIEKVKFSAQSKEKPGPLEIHFKSGLIYKYSKVYFLSVEFLINENLVACQQYNRHISPYYPVIEKIKSRSFRWAIKKQEKKEAVNA